jgi:hypothetical protein
MAGYGVRKLSFAGPTTIITPLCIMLATSVGLNLWQYGVIQGLHFSHASSKVAMATTERGREETEPTSAKVNAEKRFDQLYKEIENLSRFNDQVVDDSQRVGVTPRSGDQSVKPARVP